MSTRVVERAVESDSGEVMIRRDDEDTVIVTWFCGDRRTFSVEGLKAAIKHVEAVRPLGDVWVNLKDRSGYSFAGIIVDGEFYADRTASSIEDAYHVRWDEFVRALKKSVESPKKEKVEA